MAIIDSSVLVFFTLPAVALKINIFMHLSHWRERGSLAKRGIERYASEQENKYFLLLLIILMEHKSISPSYYRLLIELSSQNGREIGR